MEPARTIPLPVNRNRRANRPSAWPDQCCRQTLRRRALKCSKEEEDFMAEELLQVMHCAALKIQALWRGYCTRKQLYIEQGAAILLQAFWRGCLVRRILREPVARPLRIHGQHLFWDRSETQSLCSPRQEADPKPKGAKRAQEDCTHPAIIELNFWPDLCGSPGANRRPEKQLCRLVCGDRLPTRQSRSRASDNWFAVRQKYDRAATVIQAFWRGYLARRNLAVKMGAAVYIQSFYRAYRVRRELNPTPEPQPEPEDEEAEMVSFNNSFTRHHSSAHGPAPGGSQNNGTFPNNCSSSWSRSHPSRSFSRPEKPGSLSAKGDTRQVSRTGYVPSYCLVYGEQNSPLEPLSTNGSNPKAGHLVVGCFSKGAGDTRCSVDVVSRPAPLSLECVRPLKERQVDEPNLENGLPCEEAVARLDKASTRAKCAYSAPGCPALGVKLRGPLPVSQYLVQFTPTTLGARKLVRYRDQLASLSRDSQQTDFNLSDLEVPKGTVECPSEQPPRRSLKRLQEESAAAGIIQAAWKGLCARRALQEQTTAATKIQALFRSYQTRKEFESKGIYPFVRGKAVSESRSCPPCPGIVPAAQQWAASGNVKQTPPPTVIWDRETPVFAPPCTSGVQVQKSAGCRDTRPDHLEHRARRCVSTRQQHEVKTRAATVIQAAWRGHQARRELACVARAAATIQALYRSYQVRKFLGSIGKHPEGAKGSGGCGGRELREKAGDVPEHPQPHQRATWEQGVDEATSGCRQEDTSRRAQLKTKVPAILVKRNACYNPRRVTIHVKTSATDSS